MNLFGSYHCLPDCRPGFRVAAHGAGCEGDRGVTGGPSVLQGSPGFSKGGAVRHGGCGPSGEAEASGQKEQRGRGESLSWAQGVRGLARPGCWQFEERGTSVSSCPDLGFLSSRRGTGLGDGKQRGVCYRFPNFPSWIAAWSKRSLGILDSFPSS